MLRQFKATDSHDCSAIIRASIQQDNQISFGLREELLRRESPLDMSERARLFYIAVYELEGRIVGLGGVEMNEIRLLIVAHQHQRCGFGRAILEHLENMVPPALFPDVFVYSSPAGADFYSSQGYRRKGEYSLQIAGYSFQTIFMAKML